MRERTLLKVIAVALTGLLVMQIALFRKEYNNQAQASASEYYEAPAVAAVEPTDDSEIDEADPIEEISNLEKREDSSFVDEGWDELELNESSSEENEQLGEDFAEEMGSIYEELSEVEEDAMEDEYDDDHTVEDFLNQETTDLTLEYLDQNSEIVPVSISVVVIDHLESMEIKSDVSDIEPENIAIIDGVPASNNESEDETLVNQLESNVLESAKYVIVIVPDNLTEKEDINDELLHLVQIKMGADGETPHAEDENKGDISKLYTALKAGRLKLELRKGNEMPNTISDLHNEVQSGLYAVIYLQDTAETTT